jgi:hypothetical protein
VLQQETTDLARKMPVDLYCSISSPLCRTVMLVARALGVELNLKKISNKDNENRTPEFLKVSSVKGKLQVGASRRHIACFKTTEGLHSSYRASFATLRVLSYLPSTAVWCLCFNRVVLL